MSLSKKYQSINPSTTLSIDAKYKEMKQQGLDVVGFGAGEPDFDTPQHIKDAAIEAINQGFTKYTPASGTLELKKAVCRKFERENGLIYKPENIVISNGAKHSLVNALGAICNEGDEVILPAPFWVSYYEMIKLSGGVPVVLNTAAKNNFKISADDFKNAITPKTVAIILNTPSNPTGMVYTNDELEKIARVAEENNIYVISDEIYEHLVYDGEPSRSIATFGDKIKDLTIIINGVSKTYAMTGWRIGYSASNKTISTIMANVQSHATSNPNSIAQVAAVAALEGPTVSIDNMKAAFKERRDYMVTRINSIKGVSCLKPQGAFYVMMDIKDIIGKEIKGVKINGSDDFANLFLSENNVAVVPCSGFGADEYVRWSYATSMEQIKLGLDRLEEFLA